MISMFVMSIIFMVATSILLKVDWGNSMIDIGIVTLVTVFCSASLSTAVASMFKNTKIAAGVISFVVISMVFVSGAVTADLQYNKISKVTFNKWGFNAYIDIMNGKTLCETAVNFIFPVLCGLVFLVAGLIVFRREKSHE